MMISNINVAEPDMRNNYLQNLQLFIFSIENNHLKRGGWGTLDWYN